MSTRILSIDGGGILGCGPARYLRRLEEQIPGRWEHIIAGTSVGALLAALRAIGHSWAEIDGIFQSEGPKIFARPSWSWRMNPLSPKYPSDAIEAACRRYFGNLTCKDTVIPFFIPTMDMVNGKPKVYNHTDSDKLADVVLRSTAAPTYFAPREGRFVDGGLVANNPSHLAVAGAIREGVSLDSISVLSLDTGGKAWADPKVSGRMLPTSWISPIIKSDLTGNEEIGEYICDALLDDRHTRISPKIGHDYGLDSVGAMPEYTNIWETTWQDTRISAVTIATR